MLRILIFLICLWPGVVLSGEFLNAEEFDAATKGKTYYFSSNGSLYGAEEYLDGKRVRWSFLDGQCVEGRWWQEGQMICFAYENNDVPQCWSVKRGAGGGLIVLYENDPTKRELYEVKQSTKPMHCLGPKIGV